MPFKAIPPEAALEFLGPYLGQSVAVETIIKDDGSRRYLPTGTSKEMVKGLREKVNEEGIVLQVHLDGAVMSYLPTKEQRKAAILDVPALDVFVVKCDDDVWRLSHSPDIKPQSPTEKLTESFRKGSGNHIAVKKPLAIKKRDPSGGKPPGR